MNAQDHQMQDAQGSQATCFASTTQASPGLRGLPCTLHPPVLGPQTQVVAANKQEGGFRGFKYIHLFETLSEGIHYKTKSETKNWVNMSKVPCHLAIEKAILSVPQ